MDLALVAVLSLLALASAGCGAANPDRLGVAAVRQACAAEEIGLLDIDTSDDTRTEQVEQRGSGIVFLSPDSVDADEILRLQIVVMPRAEHAKRQLEFIELLSSSASVTRSLRTGSFGSRTFLSSTPGEQAI